LINLLKDTAFVFPGQGTHYAGMGKELANIYREAKEIYEIADEITGIGISKLCFEGPEAELIKTENSQPTIHTTSIAFLNILKRHYGIEAEVTAGFSLGQYAALVNANVLRFEDTVGLVKKRGLYMEQAVPMGLGKMVAIIGLSRAQVDEVVTDSKHLGHIEPSNFNCPGQIIVAGYSAPVEHAAKLAIERGAKNASFLSVSGPFHTSLLLEAGKKLRTELDHIKVNDPDRAYVDNVLGGYYLKGKDDIKKLLKEHVYKPVAWESSVNEMLDRGIRTFIEIGPNKMLSDFNKRCADAKDIPVQCFNVENVDSLNQLLVYLDRNA